jgi:hypothetical protein
MRLDQAKLLKIGEKLIDCFSDILVVISTESLLEKDIITVMDTGMNKRDYHYNNIYYLDLYEETDDEISWVFWATKQRPLIMNYLKEGFSYEDIKAIYQQGFLNGFNYQHKIKANEQLQK